MIYLRSVYTYREFYISTGVEFWVESDSEIDEDIGIEGCCVPPPELSEVQDIPEEDETKSTVKWIIALLSIFQTQFFLTKRALSWLLTFLYVLLI